MLNLLTHTWSEIEHPSSNIHIRSYSEILNFDVCVGAGMCETWYPQSCLSFPFWFNEFFVWLNPKLNLWEKKTKNYVGLANLFAKSDRIMLKCCKRANLKLKRSSPCLSNSIKSNSFYCFDVKYYSEYNRILRI